LTTSYSPHPFFPQTFFAGSHPDSRFLTSVSSWGVPDPLPFLSSCPRTTADGPCLWRAGPAFPNPKKGGSGQVVLFFFFFFFVNLVGGVLVLHILSFLLFWQTTFTSWVKAGGVPCEIDVCFSFLISARRVPAQGFTVMDSFPSRHGFIFPPLLPNTRLEESVHNSATPCFIRGAPSVKILLSWNVRTGSCGVVAYILLRCDFSWGFEELRGINPEVPFSKVIVTGKPFVLAILSLAFSAEY